MALIYLIRHGETDYNAGGRFQGHHDVPLNARGRHQAALLAGRLAAIKPAALYCSDLGRAQETARCLLPELAAMVDVRLREIDTGALTGLTLAEAESRFPDWWRLYRQDSANTPFPGGEAAAGLQRRVVAAITQIAARHPSERVAVVSHGGAVAACICAVLDLDLSRRNRLRLHNCSLSVVEWQADRRLLLVLNDTAHLSGQEG